MERKRVLALGAAVVGTVDRFPALDDKIRAKRCEVAMGGNCLNAAIVLARFGIDVSLVTKFAKDYIASQILNCLQTENIDTNSIVYVNKPGMTTGFSYIIVDESTKTRTVIHNPCEDLLDPSELPNFSSLLTNIDLLIIDGKHSNVSYQLADLANSKGIPVLLDGELECSKRPNFAEIVPRANYLKCGETFPTFWTKKDDLLEAMYHLLTNAKTRCEYVITTLGSSGSVLLKRGQCPSNSRVFTTSSWTETKKQIETSQNHEILYFQWKPNFQLENDIYIIFCPAYKNVEIKDTTGAGDVHFGSIGYSILERHSLEKTLRLAAYVASMKCRFSGIQGIPNLQEIDKEWIEKV